MTDTAMDLSLLMDLGTYNTLTESLSGDEAYDSLVEGVPDDFEPIFHTLQAGPVPPCDDSGDGCN